MTELDRLWIAICTSPVVPAGGIHHLGRVNAETMDCIELGDRASDTLHGPLFPPSWPRQEIR